MTPKRIAANELERIIRKTGSGMSSPAHAFLCAASPFTPDFLGPSKASGDGGDAFVAKRLPVRVQAGGMCLGGEWGASSGGAEFRLNER